MVFPLEIRRDCGPANTLILDFRPSELWENQLLLFQDTHCRMILPFAMPFAMAATENNGSTFNTACKSDLEKKKRISTLWLLIWLIKGSLAHLESMRFCHILTELHWKSQLTFNFPVCKMGEMTLPYLSPDDFYWDSNQRLYILYSVNIYWCLIYTKEYSKHVYGI